MVAVDIIAYLTAQGRGGVLFDAFEDESAVFTGIRSVVTPYGGPEPEYVQEDPDARISVVRFQIMTQGTNKSQVVLEAHRTLNVLARVSNRVINPASGIFYMSIRPIQSEPFFLKWSEPRSGIRQVTYTANFEAKKQAFLG